MHFYLCNYLSAIKNLIENEKINIISTDTKILYIIMSLNCVHKQCLLKLISNDKTKLYKYQKLQVNVFQEAFLTQPLVSIDSKDFVSAMHKILRIKSAIFAENHKKLAATFLLFSNVLHCKKKLRNICNCLMARIKYL